MDRGRAALADIRAQHRRADHFLRVPSTVASMPPSLHAHGDALARLHVGGAGEDVAVGALGEAEAALEHAHRRQRLELAARRTRSRDAAGPAPAARPSPAGGASPPARGAARRSGGAGARGAGAPRRARRSARAAASLRARTRRLRSTCSSRRWRRSSSRRRGSPRRARARSSSWRARRARLGQRAPAPAAQQRQLGDQVVANRDGALGRGRRRRRAQVGDEVRDREVGLVADRGDHRNAAGVDRARDRLLVERPQILQRAAAARDDDDVDVGDRLQLADARRRCPARRLRPAPACGASRIGIGKRRCATRTMSRMTAPCGDVTTPMRRGRNGSGRLRACIEQTLGAEPLLELLEGERQRARARRLDRRRPSSGTCRAPRTASAARGTGPPSPLRA